MANEAANGTVKSGVMVRVMPEQLVVRVEDNGRYVEPDRRPLILKILADGRVNVPLVVRKIEQNKLKLEAGYGRYTAVSYINAHLTDGVLEKLIQESGLTGIVVPTLPIKLPIIAETMSAEEAFFRNVSENDGGRTPTTDVDRAFNLRRAIQVFGKTEEEARGIYPNADGSLRSPAWVTQMLKITTLSKEILADLVLAERSQAVAIALADMPEEARAEVLALTKAAAEAQGTTVITATDIIKTARRIGAKTAKVGRKMTELKALLKEHSLPGNPYHAREFSKIMLQWIGDELDPATGDAVMNKQFHSRFRESVKDN